jgi:DNA-binding MarR family transcriptional regulator
MTSAAGSRPVHKPVTESVGYLLKAAQHLLRQRMDDLLRDLTLTTPQYAVLSALEEAPGLSGAALARRCFVTPQTMTGIVTNLEAAGLIARMADPAHGRIIQTRLTKAGAARLAKARRLIDRVEGEMLAGLKPAQQEALAGLLQVCVTALEQAQG